MTKTVIVKEEMSVEEMKELFFELAVELSLKFKNENMHKEFCDYYTKYFIEERKE